MTVAPGSVTFTLDIKLPPGYKLIADAPLTLREHTSGGAGAAHTFDSTTAPTIEVNVDSDRDLTLDLTLYYCQAEDERLCMIHDWGIVVPLEVKAGGQSVVRVTYRLSSEDEQGDGFGQISAWRH